MVKTKYQRFQKKVIAHAPHCICTTQIVKFFHLDVLLSKYLIICFTFNKNLFCILKTVTLIQTRPSRFHSPHSIDKNYKCLKGLGSKCWHSPPWSAPFIFSRAELIFTKSPWQQNTIAQLKVPIQGNTKEENCWDKTKPY